MADGSDSGDGGSADDRREPLGDLADRIRSRLPEDETDGEEAFDLGEYFEEERFDEVESEDLWDTIEADRTLGAEVEAGEEPDEHIVPKRSYCESCEHFSEPPEVHCTHPGTTIIEFPDIDHVRVRNCPVVAERQALGEEDEDVVTADPFGPS